MKSIFIYFLLLPSILLSQNIKDPSEVLKVLEKSELSYIIETLEDKIEQEKPTALIPHGVHMHKDDELRTLTIKNYEYEGDAKKHYADAEASFNEAPKLARKSYKKILGIMPDNSQVMTYIGQTYEIEKKYDEAIVWLEKAIDANDLDYMAHWFLADDYSRAGSKKDIKKRKKKVLRHIAEAMMLNRNNPNIQTSAKQLSEKYDFDYADWYFTPQVDVSQDSISGDVTVNAAEDWLGYAICNAAYLYEPGYREEMLEGASGYPALSAPFKEALISLYIMIDEKKTKDPQLNTFKKAVDKKMLDPYIIYEIILPEDPSFVYQLDRNTRDAIVDYIIMARFGEKL